MEFDPKLQPCPFCGGKAKFWNVSESDGKLLYVSIECEECHACSPRVYLADIGHDENAAQKTCIEMWERRRLYHVSEEESKRFFQAQRMLGEKVNLFKDPNFAAVITSVKFSLGENPSYLLKWRDGRSITESWMSEGEIVAMEKLEEQ